MFAFSRTINFVIFYLSFFVSISYAAQCPEDVQTIRTFVSSVMRAADPSDPIHVSHVKSILKQDDRLIHRLLELPLHRQVECLEEAYELALVPKGLASAILMQILSPPINNVMKQIGDFHKWDSLPTAYYEQISSLTEHAVAKIKFGNLPFIQSLSDPQSGIDLSNAPEFMQQFFAAVVKRYFDEIPSSMRREIVAAYMKLPPTAPASQQLNAVVNHAGPTLQKLFQLIARNSKSEKMKDVLEKLESGIEPMSAFEVKLLLKAAYGNKRQMSRIFSTLNRKAIAAATVGQVHFATLRDPGTEVVVKLQRRNLDHKMREELSTLLEIAPSEQAKSMIRNLEPLLEEELDFTHEASSLDKGQELYENPEDHLFVAHRVKSLETKKNILVMERAQGKTFDHLGYDGPLACAKASRLSMLLQKWFHEAIFGSGFFHGDLHGGNLFLKVNEQDPEQSDITLIDFGNSFTLNQSQQENILKFIIGVHYRSARLVLRGILGKDFEAAPDFSLEDEQEFTAFLNHLSDKDLPDYRVSQEIIDYITNRGIGVPREYLAFNRGLAFLEQQLFEANQHVDMTECQSAMAPEDIYAKEIARGLKLESWGQVFFQGLKQLSCCRRNKPHQGPQLDSEITKEVISSCVRSQVKDWTETLAAIE